MHTGVTGCDVGDRVGDTVTFVVGDQVGDEVGALEGPNHVVALIHSKVGLPSRPL